ncbi:MAG: hypothetical protein K8F52_13360 [Candidatus Scalindua rubra]|nr:hypothetical protein [Candidatus Scalindua rubra]
MRKCLSLIQIKSLNKSAEEQGLNVLIEKLKKKVFDIRLQYSGFEVNSPYLETKVRNQHAFQISLLDNVINKLENPVIVDIGDSAGTHLQYIQELYSENNNIRCISVNLDPEAIKKIKEKGFEAIQARAENLHDYNINADVFLCFQTLEHLMNPINFLYKLSSRTTAKYLIITVPYLKNSRIGLYHIRCGDKDDACAENTHIFELNPEDWKLIVRHSGWSVTKERVYLQYPKRSLLRITKALWRKYDFEGFYGMVLERNDEWSSRYKDW